LFARKLQVTSLSLQPVVVEAPFQQWGLDFVGEFHPSSSNVYKWIITATSYFSRWIEATLTKKATSGETIEFLEEKIIIKFRSPQKLQLTIPKPSNP